MKKILFLLCMMFAVAASAQTTNNYAGSSKFFDNWSIGINGGIQTNLHDWNTPEGAVTGINLNKQLTPLFGLSAETALGFNNIRNWYSDAVHVANGTAVDYVNVFAVGRFNLTNAFLGYKGVPRVFEVEALAGPGYAHRFASTASGVGTADEVLAKAGFNVNFNLGKAKAWTLYIQPAVIFNLGTTGKFDSRYGVGQLTAGVVYHFKTSNGKRHIAKSPVPALLEENAALRTQLADAAKTVAPATNAVVKTKTVEVVKEVVKYAESTYVVLFAQNSAVLSPAAKEVLDGIAEGTTVCIKAYASPEGSEAYNKTLSQNRADVVKDYLTARKVNVESAEGLGVNGTESNRVAIVTLK